MEFLNALILHYNTIKIFQLLRTRPLLNGLRLKKRAKAVGANTGQIKSYNCICFLAVGIMRALRQTLAFIMELFFQCRCILVYHDFFFYTVDKKLLSVSVHENINFILLKRETDLQTKKHT